MCELVLNSGIFAHPAITSIINAGEKRGGLHFARMMIFLEMLSNSANGFVFSNFEQLGVRRSYPLTQCEAVWNVCLELGILRKTEHGYSANGWIMDNHFHAEKERVADTGGNSARASSLRDRIPARPNVAISREYLLELKGRYTDEQLNTILDKYSAWKVEKGCTLSDDEAQLKKWGERAFKDGNNAKTGNGSKRAILDYGQLTEIYAEIGQ